MSELLTRWIELDGVVNMRDVGGLPTTSGDSVQPGRLLRSDNLQDLSPADVAHLVEALHVSDIVDLRSSTEVHTEGPGPLWHNESLTHHHHSLFADRTREVTAEQALALPDHSASTTRDARFWSDHYLGYLTARPDSIMAALGVIATSTGATIVHCAAGKDRTGTVVGMALDAVGVRHDAIIDDYALTSERLQRIIDRLTPRDLYGNALRKQKFEDQLPRPESMHTLLTALERDWGGTAGWLHAHGWTEGDVDRLRARLLG